ncbi:hypothetical protein RO3G_03919 [Rhizopus delemar RA 99-880]|uniref:Protein phosphatase PP2A regulatory subunit B n=1 Tax=Rhizopus delemar (strain RA 99-880 / ATCC MYA-4621 / FGSC 9543 / NRRL 43880) TaxID=246409 RepID=I1BSN4_RHIO9|nr:hypothetical protein RO3G_03919 [Rhizopus delemar RA 99-880]|eukprot:EIE79214.1 hypothetical protein RO3G_03919 [Rhizopus delemar RA 99-880]
MQAVTSTTNTENKWKFAQCFGDKGDSDDITEADIISAVEFDHTGDYLATGDKGGRVVLFERNENKKGCEYRFHTEFQSHEPEFDYLKSLEIEEKINQIKWCKRQNSAHFLLSTNDTIVAAIPRRIYANAHAYHINSISVNSDNETYISADDLRINLWNLNISDQSFNIVDIKPANMEELTEVITSAEFHPQHSDMRESALCDQNAKVFEEAEDPSNRSFFSEIISSISDTKFSQDGRYILSRDYLSLKIWDINMEKKPLRTINIHDNLRTKLCDLYENDCIFDKFECSFSGDGKNLMTGSYSNNVHICDSTNEREVVLQADKSVFKSKKAGSTKNGNNRTIIGSVRGNNRRDENEYMDYNKKILHASYHPRENTIAVAATNNLFIFT